MRHVLREGLFYIIFSVAGLSGAVAQSSGGLSAGTGPAGISLERAVELALARSLDLRKRFIDVSEAGYGASHLWAEIFPEISVTAGVNYGTNLFSGADPGASGGALRTTGSAGLSFRFNAGLPHAMRILSLAYETELLSYENARRQLEIQVTKSFYSLLAEKRNLINLEEALSLAERQREQNRIAFENGFLSQLVYLQSQLGAETAKLALHSAITAYNTRLGEFLALIGFDEDGTLEPEGTIVIERIDADPERLIREYLPRRPDIQSLRQNIERLELTERRTRLTGRAPSLSLSAQWSGVFSPDFSDTLSGSAGVTIPIESWIPGTRVNQTLRAAAAETEKARLDLKNAENQAMMEIRSLVENLRTSWESIGIARLRVEIAERTYELSEQGFQNGTVEFLTLEDARNGMAEARQQLLSGELAYAAMTLDLAAALNVRADELARSIR